MTNGGGIGVLATDKCAQLGMELVDLSEELKEKLRGLVPSFGSLRNPIDLTANADDTLYGKVLDVLLSAEEVHAIIALFCQTANIDPVLVAQAIITAAGSGERKKPLTVGFVGGQMAKAAVRSHVRQTRGRVSNSGTSGGWNVLAHLAVHPLFGKMKLKACSRFSAKRRGARIGPFPFRLPTGSFRQ